MKGYIDLGLAAPLRRLHRAGLRPTHVTAVSIPCGVAGTLLLYESPLFAAFLIAAYIGLDVLDGTLARVTGSQSRFGERLDFFGDRLVAALFLVVLYLNEGYVMLPAVGLVLILAVSLEDAGLIRRQR